MNINTNLYEKVEENGIETFKPYDIAKMKICGKTLEQVIDILNGLDLEKLYDLEMTMKNFGEWVELYRESNENIKQILNEMFFGKEKE